MDNVSYISVAKNRHGQTQRPRKKTWQGNESRRRVKTAPGKILYVTIIYKFGFGIFPGHTYVHMVRHKEAL